MRFLCTLAVGLLPTLAAAQSTLSADAFDALTQGKTFDVYALGAATPYGRERYAPGRRTLWNDSERICEFAPWYEKGPDICYDYGPDHIRCWQFFVQDNRILGVLTSPAREPDFIVELRETTAPMGCEAPSV